MELKKGVKIKVFVPVVFLFLLLMVSRATSSQMYWTGTVDSFWNTSGNWTPNTVPSTNDTAYFNACANNCRLNVNVYLTSLIFSPAYTGIFTPANYDVIISGDIDFSTGGSFFLTTFDTVYCTGSGLQRITGKNGVFIPTIVKDGTGTLEVTSVGLKSQGLVLRKGILSNSLGLNDTINGDFICTGGELRLNSGSIMFNGNIDFSGIQNFTDNSGIIYINGVVNQNMIPKPNVLLPAIHKISNYNLTISGAHLHSQSLKITNGQVFTNNSYNIDTINVSSGATFQSSTTNTWIDTIRFLNGNGNFYINNDELCFAGDTLNCSTLSTFIADISGILSFIGSVQTFIPNSFTTIPKIRQYGTGKTTVSKNGFIADTLEIISGEFDLGSGLIDSVSSAVKFLGGRLNFGSSVLRISSVNFDMTASTTIIPSDGTIEFSGMITQYFTPSPTVIIPKIISKSDQLHIGGNPLRSGCLNVNSGMVIMDTTMYVDTLNINSGGYLTFDNDTNITDTVGCIQGNGSLSFGKTTLYITKSASFSDFSAISGVANLVLEPAEDAFFKPKQMFTFNTIHKIGPLMTTVDMNWLSVRKLYVNDGEWNWGTAYNDTIYDSLVLMNSTMNVGSVSINFRNIIVKNGHFKLGYGHLVKIGGDAIIDFSEASEITWDYGSIRIEGELGSVTTIIPSPTLRLPNIEKSGSDTVKILGNLMGSRVNHNNGGWDWGENYNHSLRSLSMNMGAMDFKNSTVNVDSGEVSFYNGDDIKWGTGRIELSSSIGPQTIVPHPSKVLPDIIKSNSSTVKLLTNILKCHSYLQTGGNIEFSGFGIQSETSIEFNGADTLKMLDGITLQAVNEIKLSGTPDKFIKCLGQSVWNISSGSLIANFAELKNCIVSGTTGIAYGPSVDSSGNVNMVFWIDTYPPDNDMSIHLKSIDTGSVRVSWNPLLVDSLDAAEIGIWYSSVRIPESITDESAVLLGYHSLKDTVDTVVNLQAHTTYYFALAVSDTEGNWSDFTVSSSGSVRTRTIAPQLVSAPDTIRSILFPFSWKNPPGLTTKDLLYIHINEVGNSSSKIFASFSSQTTSATVQLPSKEALYKYMLSSSFDSAGLYYTDDTYIDSVRFTIDPPVLTTSTNTFDNYFPLINWSAPHGFSEIDTFFVYTDTIDGSGGWDLKGQYSGTVTSHQCVFTRYGAYKVMISTNWDTNGKISPDNVAIDTIYLIPSTSVYSWDISSDTGYQISSGVWGSNEFWSTDGKSLTAWPGAGNSAQFKGSVGNPVAIEVSGTQNADSIIFNTRGITLSGGTLNLSTGVLQGNAIDTLYSSIVSKNIYKTGSGEIVTNGMIQCDTLKIINGVMTINRTDTGSSMLPGVISVYKSTRLNGNGRIAGNIIVNGSSVLSPGGISAQSVIMDELSMVSGGMLNIDIGSQFDTITVKNKVTLAGFINIQATDGFGKGSYPIIRCTGTIIDSGIKISKTPSPLYRYSLRMEKSAVVLYIDSVITDITPPKVSVRLASGSVLVTVPESISGTAYDSISGLLSVSILISKYMDTTYWNGTTWQKNIVWIPLQKENQWIYSATGMVCSDGKYVIKAGATDSVGNIGYDTTFLIIDASPPVITKIFENVDSIGSWTGLISGEAIDSFSVVKKISVSVKNDSGKFYDGANWSAQENFFDCDGISTWSKQISKKSLADGNYTISVISFDTVGNVSKPETRYYKYFLKSIVPQNLVRLSLSNSGDSLISAAIKSENAEFVKILVGIGLTKERAKLDAKEISSNDTSVHIRATVPGIFYIATASRDLSGNVSTFNYDSISIKNSVPKISNLSDTTVDEGKTFTRQVFSSDINNDSLDFKLIQLKTGMDLNRSIFRWTPKNSDVGLTTVIIECMDSRGASAYDTFVVNVKDVHEPPIVSYEGSFEVYEDSNYSGSIKITDPDFSDTSKVTIIKIPAWLKLTQNTLVGKPLNDDVGIHFVELIYKDKDSLSDTLAFQIKVINTNDVPVFISGNVQDTMTEKQKYTCELKMTDQDANDSLSIKNVSVKTWVKIYSIKKSTGNGGWQSSIIFSPLQADTGLHDIKFEIADRSGATIYYTKKIKVLDSDDPPAKPLLVRKSASGAVQYTVNSSDDRDKLLTYSVKLHSLKNDTVLYSDSSVKLLYTMYPLSDGRYEFKAIAIDNSGQKSDISADTFTIQGASEYIIKDTGWGMVSIPSKKYDITYLKNSDYVLHWDESGVEKQVYSFYKLKTELSEIEPSKAYWRKGSLPDTIHLTANEFVKEPVSVKLYSKSSGWNQVSSPFLYPVTWPRKNDILWKWNSKINDYEEVQNILEPWSGYWVRVDTATETILSPVPVFSSGSLLKLKKTYFQSKTDWVMQVSLKSYAGNDADNKFGFNQNALDQLDEFDRPEPPAVEGRPVLFFSHNEWNNSCKDFASDIRKNWKHVNIFEIALIGGLKTDTATLYFNGFDNGSDIYLFTKLGDSIFQIDQSQRYTVTLQKGTTTYQTVFVTDNVGFLKSFPLHFKMSNPYPNPFCPITRINYTLPYRWSSDGKINQNPYLVSIEIYDIMGRNLRNLIYRKMIPGNYTVVWDGKMTNGRIAASGKYYCVLKADDLKHVRNLTLIK